MADNTPVVSQSGFSNPITAFPPLEPQKKHFVSVLGYDAYTPGSRTYRCIHPEMYCAVLHTALPWNYCVATSSTEVFVFFSIAKLELGVSCTSKAVRGFLDVSQKERHSVY